MQLSVDFFARILGALVAGVLFAAIGQTVAELFSASVAGYAVVFGLVGILAGLILTPYITTRPIRSLRNRLVRMPPERLGAIILGIFMGLIAAALISFPSPRCPILSDRLGHWSPWSSFATSALWC